MASDYDRRMAQLRQRFAERLESEAEFLRVAGSRLHQPETLAELAERTHKLAGLAGSMGFPEVSGMAKRLEGLLLRPETDQEDLSPAIGELLTALELATDRLPAAGR